MLGKRLVSGLLVVAIVASSIRIAAATEPTPAAKKRARTLFEEGIDAFNKKDFDRAVDAFGQAYQLSHVPALLFNIAQVYRTKGDCAAALGYYVDHVKLMPEAANRGEVEGYIKEMKECVAKQEAGKASPAPENPVAIVAPSTPTDTTPKARPSGKLLRWGGTGAIALGALFLGIGIGCAASAASTASDVAQAFNMSGAAEWNPTLNEKDASGRSTGTAAAAFLVLGTAAVLGGGAAYYFGWRRDHAPKIALNVLSGGGELVWTQRF